MPSLRALARPPSLRLPEKHLRLIFCIGCRACTTTSAAVSIHSPCDSTYNHNQSRLQRRTCSAHSRSLDHAVNKLVTLLHTTYPSTETCYRKASRTATVRRVAISGSCSSRHEKILAGKGRPPPLARGAVGSRRCWLAAPLARLQNADVPRHTPANTTFSACCHATIAAGAAAARWRQCP